MRGIQISRTTDLPAFINIGIGVILIFLTVEIVRLNQRHDYNNTRAGVQLAQMNSNIERISDKLNQTN